jgi:hypothetical protein
MTYTYSPQAFIQTIAEAHESQEEPPTQYDRAVAGAIATLIRRNVQGTRRQIEQRLGLRDGIITLIVNGRGYQTPVVKPSDWQKVLVELGAKGATFADSWAGYSHLLRDLFLLAGFDLGETKFEDILRACGTEWRHLPAEFRAWRDGEFTPRSRALLDRVLNVDLFKEENGDAFCDVLHDWSNFTGRDTEDLPQ